MSIEILQGDSTTLTEAITGLSSLSGFTAKLYIKTTAGVAVDTITGTINTLTVTYNIYNNSSKGYALGTHNFETKIFNSTYDLVYTPSSGIFTVIPSLTPDPS